MLKTVIPRSGLRPLYRPYTSNVSLFQPIQLSVTARLRRTYATEVGKFSTFAANNEALLTIILEEKDLVIIGGGVAGYVAAIKAGQSGLKV